MKQFAQQRRKGNKQFGVDYRWLRSSFFYVRLKERLLASQLIPCHTRWLSKLHKLANKFDLMNLVIFLQYPSHKIFTAVIYFLAITKYILHDYLVVKKRLPKSEPE